MNSLKMGSRKKDGGWQAYVNYKSQDGSWKQKAKQGFKSKSEAEMYAFELAKSIQEENKLNVELFEVTVADLVKMYLNTIKKETSKAQINMILKNLKPIYDKRVVDVTVYDIESLNILPSYAKIVKTLFNYAIKKLEIINKSPARFLESYKSKKNIAINADQFEDSFIVNVKPKFVLFYKFAFYCGLRSGEIKAIKPKNIDFDKNILSVYEQVQYLRKKGYELVPPKSKNSTRKVPIPEKLALETKEYIDEKGFSQNDLIFKDIIKTKDFKEDFLKSSDKTVRKCTLHSLRHSYGSNLLAQGVSIATIAKVMGDDISTIINTYLHTTDAYLGEVIDVINQ